MIMSERPYLDAYVETVFLLYCQSELLNPDEVESRFSQWLEQKTFHQDDPAFYQ
jgi:hypothetical protein